MSASLGIDVSKATLDVYLLPADGAPAQFQQFSNDAEGGQALLDWLAQAQVGTVHACLEATGHYWCLIAHLLHAAGHVVSVVNPLQIKAFRTTTARRGKTDAQDARLIAHFCQLHRPDPWQPVERAQAQLRDLCRRRQALLKMRQMERNRLKSGLDDPAVRASIERIMAAFTTEIETLETAIQQHLKQHHPLAQQVRLLQSLPGIGAVSAPILLAEIGDLSRLTRANQLVAYAGLDPQPHQSGSSIRKPTRISKRGNARLRAALFMPAVVAKNRSDYFKPLVERMEQAGHCPLSIVCAVMRKLLHLIFAILRSGQAFDPDFQQHLAFAA